jgi:hypothetical protein
MGILLTCLPRLSPCDCDQSFVPPGICSCHRDLKIPIALMGKLLTCLPRLSLAHRSTPGGTCRRDLESSHRPDGRLTLCSLFAGRRCRSLWRHSGHHIVHHQWEYSYLCACSCSKVPIAPMGNCLRSCPDSRLHNCERFGQLQRVCAA